MLYLIDSAANYNLIDEEISRVAASEYSEENVPMYDAIVLHSNDKATIKRHQDDAVNAIVKRNYDIVTIEPNNQEGKPGLRFNVPDMDPSTEGIISQELTRFITLNVCAAWFQTRAKNHTEEYTARGQVALDKATVLLHTRKAPTR